MGGATDREEERQGGQDDARNRRSELHEEIDPVVGRVEAAGLDLGDLFPELADRQVPRVDVCLDRLADAGVGRPLDPYEPPCVRPLDADGVAQQPDP